MQHLMRQRGVGSGRAALCALRALGAVALACGLAGVLGGCNTQNVRPGAKSILEVFERPSPETAARMALDEADPNARYQGTQMLAAAPFAGEEVYMRLFTERLTDPDPGVRAVAARAVGTHGGREHAPALIAMLRDKDVGVRTEAARALQRIHAPQSIAALSDALDPMKEEEPAVRAEAAAALGQYRTGAVVQRLIAALEDDNVAVNTRVADALRTLTGADFGTSRGAWQAWYRDQRDLFAAGGGYTYPVFQRERRWWEHLPLVPAPPNEATSIPAGLSPAVGGPVLSD